MKINQKDITSLKPSFLVFIVVIILSSFIFVNESKSIKRVYTIEKAQYCFHNQALKKCQNLIQACLERDLCQKQIQMYEECNFQHQVQNQIFNGYCFRRWIQQSDQTKSLINCVQNQCNFAGYNSYIGLRQLYQCSQEALIQFQQACDQQCQQQLKQKISTKVFYNPLEELYSIQSIGKLNNEQAKRVTEIVLKECISKDGSIRVRHQRQAKQSQQKKRKLFDYNENKQQINKVVEEQVKIKQINNNSQSQSQL